METGLFCRLKSSRRDIRETWSYAHLRAGGTKRTGKAKVCVWGGGGTVSGDCSHGWVARGSTLRRADASLLPGLCILGPLKSVAWTWWVRTGRWLSGEDEGRSLGQHHRSAEEPGHMQTRQVGRPGSGGRQNEGEPLLIRLPAASGANGLCRGEYLGQALCPLGLLPSIDGHRAPRQSHWVLPAWHLAPNLRGFSGTAQSKPIVSSSDPGPMSVFLGLCGCLQVIYRSLFHRFLSGPTGTMKMRSSQN